MKTIRFETLIDKITYLLLHNIWHFHAFR